MAKMSFESWIKQPTWKVKFIGWKKVLLEGEVFYHDKTPGTIFVKAKTQHLARRTVFEQLRTGGHWLHSIQSVEKIEEVI